jgi:hypothetical protein
LSFFFLFLTLRSLFSSLNVSVWWVPHLPRILQVPVSNLDPGIS